MTQPGYQEGSEPMWWWKVAQRLDEAQLALANAMAHNVDDPRPIHALHDRLREGQAILLDIFRAKGLLPGSTNGAAAPGPATAGMPGMPMPGMPMTPSGEAAAVPQTAEPIALLAVDAPAVSEADHAVAASEPEQAAAVPSSEPASPTVTAEVLPTAAPAAPAAPGAGGAGG